MSARHVRLRQPLNLVPWNRKVYEGEYGCEHFYSYLALGHPRLRIVDIGANCGAFGGWVLALLPQGGKCDYAAFEPQRELQVCIELAVPGAKVTSAAVTGLEHGTLALTRLRGSNAGEWRLGPPESTDWEVREVPTVPAASLPQADILKLDCEGSEGEILENYPHLSTCRYVCYEWHGQAQQTRCAAVLAARGFVPVKAVAYGPDRGVMCWLRQG